MLLPPGTIPHSVTLSGMMLTRTFFFTTLACTALAGLSGYWAIQKLSQESTRFLKQETGDVHLKVVVRDSSRQPLSGVKILVFLPEQRVACTTTEGGNCEGIFTSPQGQTILVTASGKNFQATKKLLIPRLSPYRAELLFEPSQTESGQMSLLSKSLDDVNGRILNAITRTKELDDWVAIAPERQLPEHNLPLLRDQLLTVLREDLATIKEQHGASQFVLRGLWNERPYVEVTARDHKGRIKGGFLFKAGSTDSHFLRMVITKMWVSPAGTWGPMPRPVLTIQTQQPSRLRAYLNGILMPSAALSGMTQFWAKPGTMPWLPTTSAKDSVAVAATADQSPLLRATVKSAELQQGLNWQFAAPALSQRSD